VDEDESEEIADVEAVEEKNEEFATMDMKNEPIAPIWEDLSIDAPHEKESVESSRGRCKIKFLGALWTQFYL